jgi:hypothetical protein
MTCLPSDPYLVTFNFFSMSTAFWFPGSSLNDHS